MDKSEPDTIALKKRTVCPKCGMTVKKGGQMYRSLTKPNTFICTTCAIKEQKQKKKMGVS